MMLSLYDRPGSYLVDHPNAKKQIKRIVAATTATVAAALMIAPAASARVHVNPGQCCAGQYHLHR